MPIDAPLHDLEDIFERQKQAADKRAGFLSGVLTTSPAKDGFEALKPTMPLCRRLSTGEASTSYDGTFYYEERIR